MQLYHVHKFLGIFLKRKMERELQKYKVVEKAYHKIKSGTGFNNPAEIVNKFVNRERTYNNLLTSIADYEKKNDELYKECASL